MRAFNGFHNFLMTLPAGLFGYFTATRRDVNVVFKPTGCEVIRMPETVARFGCVLADESWWRVAIIADGYRSMA